jgi:dienelactone hydrolase
MRTIVLTALLTALTCAAGSIETMDVNYTDGTYKLRGFAAWPTDRKPTAAVLICHQWMGLTDYERGRARQLAEMGYYAFALDIYGAETRPADRSEAPKFAGKYKGDRNLYRQRLNAGLAQLRQMSGLGDDRINAIGYCFGGTGVLELARSGAAIAGVVSFHGGLGSPTPKDAHGVKAKVLVCHGAEDPFVKPEEIAGFQKEMIDGKVDWQMIYYADSVHSFTQKMAGNDKSRGAAYNAEADARSWEPMKTFFVEALAGK